ncbi:metal-dependent hydrolase, partial [bacterium]|nr:metal-dependent hydrolase [bacterium]MBU1025343.1 metal-dependent hydrolase [bacterium]
AVLPIDGFYNMSPKAAARAVQLLQSEQVMPIHHSTFPILWGKPKMLRAELDNLGLNDVNVIKTSPGTVIEL